MDVQTNGQIDGQRLRDGSEASLIAREDNVNADEYCYNKHFREHATDYHWPDDGAWCGQGMLVDSDVFITLVLVT